MPTASSVSSSRNAGSSASTSNRSPFVDVAMEGELATAYDRFVSRGAKGDQELRHHALVRDYLPSGHLTRRGDRHAELVVLSDALHELDRLRAEADQPPASADEARAALAGAALTATGYGSRATRTAATRPGRRESCLRDDRSW